MAGKEGAEAATEARDVAVAVEPEARSFVEGKSLGRELDAALELAKECLAGSSRIRVALVDDPDEEDASCTVVLRLKNSLTQPDFMSARKRFYRSVRSAGLARLCQYLAVVGVDRAAQHYNVVSPVPNSFLNRRPSFLNRPRKG